MYFPSKMARLCIFIVLLLSSFTRVEADKDLHISDSSSPQWGHPDWMKMLPDSMKLCEMTLPATHDTGSDNWGSHISLGFPSLGIAQTQSLSFWYQLIAGIRYFDLRAYHSGINHILIVHGDYDMGHTLNDVLFACSLFLQSFPTETILIQISESGGLTQPPISESIRYFLKEYGATGVVWPAAGLNRPDGQPTTAAASLTYVDRQSQDLVRKNILSYMPTLGEVRGRMVIIYDDQNEQDAQALGYKWNSPISDRWDKFELGGTTSTSQKWSSDKERFDRVQNLVPQNLFQFTGINAAYSDAAAVALTPYVLADGMNRSLLDYIQTDGTSLHGQNLGIVAMDYPGPALVDSLIALNFKYVLNQQSMAYDFGVFAIHTVMDLPNSLSLQLRADNLKRIFNRVVPAKEINTVLFKNFSDVITESVASTNAAWSFETVVPDGDSSLFVHTFASDRLPGKTTTITSALVEPVIKAWVDSRVNADGLMLDPAVVNPDALKSHLAANFPQLEWKVFYSATRQFPQLGTHETSMSLGAQNVSARYNRVTAASQFFVYSAQWDAIGSPKAGQHQVITFPSFSDTLVTAATLPLSAVASSGLGITYTSSDAEVAEVLGKTLVLKKPGKTTIHASQPGNATWYPAQDAFQTLTVLPSVELKIQANQNGSELVINNSGGLHLYVQQSDDCQTWEAIPPFTVDGVTSAAVYGLLGFRSEGGAVRLDLSIPEETVPIADGSPVHFYRAFGSLPYEP